MKLTPSDMKKLGDAHPDLQKVVLKCAEIIPAPFAFRIGETARSVAQQKANVAKGVSWTMKSRHIVSKDGHSRAVDLLAMPDGKTVTWSWPPYYVLAAQMKRAAQLCGVPIEWGGDWKKTKDGPHFQLPWDTYP